jgi:predicted transcriptional regulator
LEEEISKTQEELSKEDVVSDYIKLSELQEVLEKLETELEKTFEEWEKLSLLALDS